MAAQVTRLHRDYGDVEYREPVEGYTGEEPLNGIYPFRLVGLEDHVSGAGNDSLHWTFEATADALGKTGDCYEGWRGHLYTNDEGAAWKEQQIMVALGVIKPNGSYRGTIEALLKKYGRVTIMGRVQRERYVPEDGGDPEWRAKLQTVMKSRDGAGTKRRTDDDDVDEPDEEVTERRTRAKATPRTRRVEPEPELDEAEEEVAEYDDLDELAEELGALSLVALKKRAKEEFEFTAGDLRGLDKDEIIDAILDKLEEEVEEEPEPELPKRAARSRTTTKAAPKRTRGSRAARDDEDDEPPF